MKYAGEAGAVNCQDNLEGKLQVSIKTNIISNSAILCCGNYHRETHTILPREKYRSIHCCLVYNRKNLNELGLIKRKMSKEAEVFILCTPVKETSCIHVI